MAADDASIDDRAPSNPAPDVFCIATEPLWRRVGGGVDELIDRRDSGAVDARAQSRIAEIDAGTLCNSCRPWPTCKSSSVGHAGLRFSSRHERPP
jgi:hypothetical protein